MTEDYFRATMSAARTRALFVLAFLVVRTIVASRKPADRNSSRKAPPSFAPAIHANQLASSARTDSGNGSLRISSAEWATPPGAMTRPSSSKISVLAGLRLIRATSIDSSDRGRLSAAARARTMLCTPEVRIPPRARPSIAPLKSIPTTRPSGPTRRAATRESNPAPQPRSSTVSPGANAARIDTFDTPVKASTATSGRSSSTERG